MTELDNIFYSYKTPEGVIPAVNGITAKLCAPVTAVVGKTGSGKSTLGELICGITKPGRGRVLINGEPPDLRRHGIGFVFQYPEHQLFADTVYDDIAYGPSLAGITGKELENRVKEAAELTELDQELLSLSPFELSGGQKRLAALAGILAQQPSLLLLDEPAAGLDPHGRKTVFSIIKDLAEKRNVSVIFVTHSMDDAAEHADEILVLNKGKAAAFGTPDEIFGDTAALDECGLTLPETMRLGAALKKRGISVSDMLTIDRAFNSVMALFDSHGAMTAKGV